MRNNRFQRISVVSVVFLALASYACANTWYVDPVDGNDSYNASSPFFVIGTNIGPAKTIQRAATAAGQYDIVVLLDGFYSGYQNASQSTIAMVDSKHLYCISDGGPQNCMVELYQNLSFSVPASPPAGLETVISGVTFVCDGMLSQPPINVQNNSTVRFEDCVFDGFQSSAPVVYINFGRPVFQNCVFMQNSVNAIFWCQQNAEPTITNCVFSENNNYNNSAPTTVINCINNANPTVRGCTFVDNVSTSPLYVISVAEAASVTVDDCVFENNTSTTSSTDACAGIYFNSTAGRVSRTRFENNRSTLMVTSYRSAGIMIQYPEGDIFIDDCKFYDNAAGIYLYASGTDYSMEVDNCEFIGNTSLNTDPSQSENIGGIVLQMYSPLADINVRQCTFQNNYSGIRTMSSVDFRSLDVTHCLITSNTFVGLAIQNMYHPADSYGRLNVDYCTFADNGQYEFQANYALIENTIVRHTPTANIPNVPYLTINYSNIQGGWMGAGTGNINVDPLFAEPGFWHADPALRIPGTDYHLKSTAGRWDPEQETWVLDTQDSPCIDAGDPSVVPIFETAGSGGHVNMGAYGNTPQASRSDLCEGGDDGTGMMFSDINHDCLVNLADFAVLAGQWLQSTLAG